MTHGSVCRKIKDLALLLPVLGKFVYLEELELADNELAVLPGSLSVLKSLSSLTLSGNPFSDLKPVADSLRTLPALRRLTILPCGPSDLALLSAALPGLDQLNDQSTFCATTRV